MGTRTVSSTVVSIPPPSCRVGRQPTSIKWVWVEVGCMEQNTDSTNAETPAEVARAIADDVDLWEDIEEQHGMPVWESDSLTIYADEHGHELNELAEYYGVGRSELSEWMHDQARGAEYDWSHVDPIVLLHD